MNYAEIIEVEKDILAMSLTDEDAVVSLLSNMKSNDFHKKQHSVIYQAIESLYKERGENGFTRLGVVSKLSKEGKLQYVGGSYTIANLVRRIENKTYSLREFLKDIDILKQYGAAT